MFKNQLSKFDGGGQGGGGDFSNGKILPGNLKRPWNLSLLISALKFRTNQFVVTKSRNMDKNYP